MSFSLGGPPKTASGFTLPSATPTTTPSTGFSFGGVAQPGSGDNKAASTLFSTPVKPVTTTASTGSLGFGFGGPAKTSASLSFGTATPQTTQAPTLGGFGFGAGTTSSAAATTAATTSAAAAPPSLQFSFGGAAASTAVPAASTSTTSFTPILGGASASTTTSTAASSTPASSSTGLLFGTPAVAASVASVPKLGLGTTTSAASTGAGFSLGGTTATASVAPSQTTKSQAVPTASSLTFSQLEDSINKWTIDLEEQGKFFVNQAKQLNAWDTLLISNGEKILNLNSSIEKVKQQQSQLDQELDFILAQQKELEELVGPLEKELIDIPVQDIDRNQMYQYAEVIDSQLKQILDDLKEIIENINESNRDEEVAANPITQISKILNAHMGSLEWIDTNTAQISRQLDELSKLEEATKKNLSLNHSSTSMFM